MKNFINKFEDNEQEVLFDKSDQINIELLSNVIENKNLLNLNSPNIINGYYLGREGQYLESSIYNISPYILIQPNTLYTYSLTLTNFGGFVCFYKINGDFISSLMLNNIRNFTTPIDCYFLRMSYINKLNIFLYFVNKVF